MPGQGSTYLDQLALLNEQNFLGGAAVYGKAIKEKKQNETLVDLYNKFKADKNELQTTMEQTGDFNKYLNEVDTEGKTPNEVDAFVNFMGSINKVSALGDFYQPFITAFATLGDEGVQIANSLTSELAGKIDLEQRKGEIPIKQLELQNQLLVYRSNKATLGDYFESKKKQKLYDEIEDFVIRQSDIIDAMPLTQSTYSNTKQGLEYQMLFKQNTDALKKRVLEQYPDASSGLIDQAISYALTIENKALGQIQQLKPEPVTGVGSRMVGNTGISEELFNMSLREMERVGTDWNNLPDATKTAVALYQGGQAPDSEGMVNGVSKDQIEYILGNLENFISAQANILPVASAYGDSWFNTKKIETTAGAYTEATFKDIKNAEGQIVYDLSNIIRAKNISDLVNRKYYYNPFDRDKVLGLLNEAANKLDEGNTFPTGEVESLYDINYDDMFNKGFPPGMTAESKNYLINQARERVGGRIKQRQAETFKDATKKKQMRESTEEFFKKK